MRELISYTEALQAVLAAAPSVATESISSYSAFGRVIAEDVTARDNVPPFNNSAMDGFAVIHTDLANTPSTLTIVDDIPAGGLPSRAIAPGLCARIMTGAPIPEGATAIVPIEWTNVEGDSVTIHTAPEDGQHVRLAGADIGSGQVVLSAGTSITPPVSGLLAATGHSMVSVAVRPVVAVVATGDEIVDAGEDLGPGKIRNSNGPALAAQVLASGAHVLGPVVARDSRLAVEEVLDTIHEADVFVFAGGVSVGDYDFVQEALEKRGMETVFWRVRQRPGKPLLFGTMQGKPVFGLPGNPVSASVCFEMYVRPLLRKALGASPVGQQSMRAISKITKKKGLHYFARAISSIRDGVASIELAGPQASNIYSTMARANCIAHLPEDRDVIEAGELIQITPLAWSLQ